MKTILSLIVTFLALLIVAPSFAGILDGAPADPEKRARPGGYNEQVANRNSLMTSCRLDPIKDGGGNVIGYSCGPR